MKGQLEEGKQASENMASAQRHLATVFNLERYDCGYKKELKEMSKLQAKPKLKLQCP
jgi:hypothetical protein